MNEIAHHPSIPEVSAQSQRLHSEDGTKHRRADSKLVVVGKRAFEKILQVSAPWLVAPTAIHATGPVCRETDRAVCVEAAAHTPER